MIQTFGWFGAQLPRLILNDLVVFLILCHVYQISLNV